jgi:hypothetical protein
MQTKLNEFKNNSVFLGQYYESNNNFSNNLPTTFDAIRESNLHYVQKMSLYNTITTLLHIPRPKSYRFIAKNYTYAPLDAKYILSIDSNCEDKCELNIGSLAQFPFTKKLTFTSPFPVFALIGVSVSRNHTCKSCNKSEGVIPVDYELLFLNEKFDIPYPFKMRFGLYIFTFYGNGGCSIDDVDENDVPVEFLKKLLPPDMV